MNVEENEARHCCAGEDQEQFDRSIMLGEAQAACSETISQCLNQLRYRVSQLLKDIIMNEIELKKIRIQGNRQL
jgi:hypothetical protein